MKAQRQPLAGGTANVIEIEPTLTTHLRLTIHPDGGVARLRVLGEVVPDPRRWAGLTVDLAAAANGGTVLDARDRFFSPPENAIRPGPAVPMGDGWARTHRATGPPPAPAAAAATGSCCTWPRPGRCGSSTSTRCTSSGTRRARSG